MSGRNITLLKCASSGALGKVVGLGGKYLEVGGRLGKGLARAAGGGDVAQGLGTAAGVGAAIAAPILAARQTRIGRKAERAVGKGLGVAGRVGERVLTPGDWGTYEGETF